MGGQTRNRIARLETDGRLDQTLNLNIVGSYVYATAVQPDGKILIGGIFTSVLGVTRNNIARLNTDGTLDTAFNPNANNDVDSIAVQADGKILVGGFFTDEQHRRTAAQPHRPARCHRPAWQIRSTRTRTISVNSHRGAGGRQDSSGRRFQERTASADRRATASPGSIPPPAWLIRSTRTRTSVVLFNRGAGGRQDSGGRLFHEHRRTARATASPGSMPPPAWRIRSTRTRHGICQFNRGAGGRQDFSGRRFQQHRRTDAQSTSPGSTPPPAWLIRSTRTRTGRCLFNRGAGGRQDFSGRRFRATASADRRATTSPGSMPRPAWPIRSTRTRTVSVYSIAVQADGKILAGGSFTSIGGQSRSLFARLSNDTAALQNLAVTQTTITWTRGGSSPQFARVTFESSTDNVNYTSAGQRHGGWQQLDPDRFEPSDRTEHLHPRARLLSQRLLTTARRASRNRCGMRFLLGAVATHDCRFTQDAWRRGRLRYQFAAHGRTGDGMPQHLPALRRLSSPASNNLVSGNASVTSGTGNVSGAPIFADNTMTVNLTGVTDVQRLTVTLSERDRQLRSGSASIHQ